MPFMLLMLGVVIVMTVIAFFKLSPHVSNPRALLAFNAASVALGTLAAIGIGLWLYDVGVVVKANEKGMATYLAITGGGTVALLVVVVAGLVRNFVIFPPSKRLVPPGTTHAS